MTLCLRQCEWRITKLFNSCTFFSHFFRQIPVRHKPFWRYQTLLPFHSITVFILVLASKPSLVSGKRFCAISHALQSIWKANAQSINSQNGTIATPSQPPTPILSSPVMLKMHPNQHQCIKLNLGYQHAEFEVFPLCTIPEELAGLPICYLSRGYLHPLLDVLGVIFTPSSSS